MHQPEDENSVESSIRDVPVDWEALENAFENNAPEVHSYLQVVTGDVLRVVDGVADPQMHARIAADTNYLRVEAVSSREQYRWMERYIPTVEDPKLRSRLEFAIDGKGAFRRFKDVLMSFGPERERWFTYRSERLRTFMEAWLHAHSIKAVPRVQWLSSTEDTDGGGMNDDAPRSSGHLDSNEFYRYRGITGLRRTLRELAGTLGPRDIEAVVAFAEFLKSRRAARSFAHHHGAYQQHGEYSGDEAMDGDDEVDGSNDDVDDVRDDLLHGESDSIGSDVMDGDHQGDSERYAPRKSSVQVTENARDDLQGGSFPKGSAGGLPTG